MKARTAAVPSFPPGLISVVDNFNEEASESSIHYYETSSTVFDDTHHRSSPGCVGVFEDGLASVETFMSKIFSGCQDYSVMCEDMYAQSDFQRQRKANTSSSSSPRGAASFFSMPPTKRRKQRRQPTTPKLRGPPKIERVQAAIDDDISLTYSRSLDFLFNRSN